LDCELIVIWVTVTSTTADMSMSAGELRKSTVSTTGAWVFPEELPP